MRIPCIGCAFTSKTVARAESVRSLSLCVLARAMPSTSERLERLEEQVSKAQERIDAVNTYTDAVATLAVQTANRQGIEIAKRSLVLFVKGAAKELLEKLGKWNESSALPPEQRPSQRPRPWKLQVADFIVHYLETKAAPMTPEEVLTQLKLLLLVLEAVSHPKPRRQGEDSVWPVQLTLRNSEGAQLVKDALLHDCFRNVMRKDHDLGIKVSRHLPGQATRSVLKELGEDVKGKGKGEGDRGQDSRANQRQRR